MRTSSTSAIEIILGLTPLHLVINRISKETIMRISRPTREKGLKIDPKDQNLILKSNPILGACRDDIGKTFNFNKFFKSELSTKREWVSVNSTYDIEPSSIVWYTDGSKTSEGTGAGVYGPRAAFHIPMGCHQSAKCKHNKFQTDIALPK